MVKLTLTTTFVMRLTATDTWRVQCPEGTVLGTCTKVAPAEGHMAWEARVSFNGPRLAELPTLEEAAQWVVRRWWPAIVWEDPRMSVDSLKDLEVPA